MKKILIVNDPFTELKANNLKSIFGNNVIVEQLILSSAILDMYECKTVEFDLTIEQLLNLRQVAEIVTLYITTNDYDVACGWSTSYLRNLMPMISVMLQCGIVADVDEINLIKDDIELKRPTHEDKMKATICSNKRNKIVMTLKHIDVELKSPINDKCKTHNIKTTIDDMKIKSFNKTRNKDLKDEKVIFAGGRGFGNNYDILNELISYVNIGIGCSKASVDSGWISREHQIGMSGKSVMPDMYIALGIEGYMHHIVGIEQAKKIISVNSSFTAAINKISDVVIEGDAVEFSQLLVERLKINK